MIAPVASGCTNTQLATDVKPDNILVDHGKGTNRFSRVALGDCGDAYRLKSDQGLVQGTHGISH